MLPSFMAWLQVNIMYLVVFLLLWLVLWQRFCIESLEKDLLGTTRLVEYMRAKYMHKDASTLIKGFPEGGRR